jgi:hypothetical protein
MAADVKPRPFHGNGFFFHSQHNTRTCLTPARLQNETVSGIHAGGCVQGGLRTFRPDGSGYRLTGTDLLHQTTTYAYHVTCLPLTNSDVRALVVVTQGEPEQQATTSNPRRV